MCSRRRNVHACTAAASSEDDSSAPVVTRCRPQAGVSLLPAQRTLTTCCQVVVHFRVCAARAGWGLPFLTAQSRAGASMLQQVPSVHDMTTARQHLRDWLQVFSHGLHGCSSWLAKYAWLLNAPFLFGLQMQPATD